MGPPAAPHASEALGGDDEEVGAGVYEELLGDVRVQKVIDQVVREQRLEQQQREVNSLSQAMFSTRQKLKTLQETMEKQVCPTPPPPSPSPPPPPPPAGLPPRAPTPAGGGAAAGLLAPPPATPFTPGGAEREAADLLELMPPSARKFLERATAQRRQEGAEASTAADFRRRAEEDSRLIDVLLLEKYNLETELGEREVVLSAIEAQWSGMAQAVQDIQADSRAKDATIQGLREQIDVMRIQNMGAQVERARRGEREAGGEAGRKAEPGLREAAEARAAEVRRLQAHIAGLEEGHRAEVAQLAQQVEILQKQQKTMLEYISDLEVKAVQRGSAATPEARDRATSPLVVEVPPHISYNPFISPVQAQKVQELQLSKAPRVSTSLGPGAAARDLLTKTASNEDFLVFSVAGAESSPEKSSPGTAGTSPDKDKEQAAEPATPGGAGGGGAGPSGAAAATARVPPGSRGRSKSLFEIGLEKDTFVADARSSLKKLDAKMQRLRSLSVVVEGQGGKPNGELKESLREWSRALREQRGQGGQGAGA